MLHVLEEMKQSKFHSSLPPQLHNLVLETIKKEDFHLRLFVFLHDISKSECMTFIYKTVEGNQTKKVKKIVKWSEWEEFLENGEWKKEVEKIRKEGKQEQRKEEKEERKEEKEEKKEERKEEKEERKEEKKEERKEEEISQRQKLVEKGKLAKEGGEKEMEEFLELAQVNSISYFQQDRIRKVFNEHGHFAHKYLQCNFAFPYFLEHHALLVSIKEHMNYHTCFKETGRANIKSYFKYFAHLKEETRNFHFLANLIDNLATLRDGSLQSLGSFSSIAASYDLFEKFVTCLHKLSNDKIPREEIREIISQNQIKACNKLFQLISEANNAIDSSKLSQFFVNFTNGETKLSFSKEISLEQLIRQLSSQIVLDEYDLEKLEQESRKMVEAQSLSEENFLLLISAVKERKQLNNKTVGQMFRKQSATVLQILKICLKPQNL